MSRLSRLEFARYCNVKPGSFQNWEGPRFGGLTEKAAKKIIQGAKTLGINCTLEWLMHGISPGPQVEELSYLKTRENLADRLREEPAEYAHNPDHEYIAKELLVFRTHYPHAIDYMIDDDAMEPSYRKGDYVAGRIASLDEIDDQDCIVKLITNEVLVRRVKKMSIMNDFTLICLNPNTSIARPVIYQADISFAAPITWLRRPRKIKNS